MASWISQRQIQARTTYRCSWSAFERAPALAAGDQEEIAWLKQTSPKAMLVPEVGLVRQDCPRRVTVSCWANGGPALNAQLAKPSDVVVDSAGNLYIGDIGNSRV